MKAESVKPISPEERRRWEKHNLETLREWRAFPLGEKIRMIEELEKLAHSIHGDKLPQTLDEHEEPNGTAAR